MVQTFHALGVVKRRHQGPKDTSPRARLREEAALASNVDQILATCSDEVFELVRIGADLRRVAVVPCGVDLELFRPDGPATPRGRQGRLLVVSRLVERKGIGNVITAMARLPQAELVVAGGPPAAELGADPEARRLTALAERAGVTGRVRLLGRVGRSDLPALYRSADLVVTVPWYEPFGIVPLEAMACGVPVVASAVGGLVDSVVDGVTGVHVPPRRPGPLVAALAGLLADPERRAALGAAGVRRARRYDWDRIARSTLEVYTARVAAPPAGKPARRPAGQAARLPAGRPAELPGGLPGGLPADPVDDRRRRLPPQATLPLRGASQPEVGLARAPGRPERRPR